MKTDETVIGILRKLSGKEEIRTTDSLLGELALDSLAMVTLLIELEDAFGIELEESDMDPFLLETVEDMIALADKYQRDD